MHLPPLVDTGPPLGEAARRRYARHTLLHEMGEEGQRRLANARVLVIGAGGLGSVTATYLAAAGVGTLGIVDDDIVEESNLQRQVLHGTSDLGRPKVESAADRLRDLNPLVTVRTHPERIVASNARTLVTAYDLVVDGADNFATRYVVADACALQAVPHVWGSILRFDGQASVWWPPHGPCYRCVFPAPPAAGSVLSCAEAGVLGSLCASIGAICTTEAVKLITGAGRPLIGRLVVHDALDQTYAELPLRADPSCALCSPRATITVPGQGLAPAAVAATGVRWEPRALADRLGERDAPVLIDVREPAEWGAGMIAGARGIPLNRLADAAGLTPGSPVILYCAAGARSLAGAEDLRARGFTDVSDLAGGVRAWTAAGLPLTTP